MTNDQIVLTRDEAKTIMLFLKDAANYWVDSDQEYASNALDLRDELKARLADDD